MTHLGCRITLVKENISRWSTWFFGKKHTGDFSSEIEFIGPKTPYTSSLACSVAKEKARVNELYLLHTKNPSSCRILSETHHPKIKILSNVTLTDAETILAYQKRNDLWGGLSLWCVRIIFLVNPIYQVCFLPCLSRP